MAAQPRKIWRRLPVDVQERLKAVIGGLLDDPRPHGYRRLSGHEELYRVRAGDWRVIYHIDDSRRLVIVVAIGPRGQVYREL